MGLPHLLAKGIRAGEGFSRVWRCHALRGHHSSPGKRKPARARPLGAIRERGQQRQGLPESSDRFVIRIPSPGFPPPAASNGGCASPPALEVDSSREATSPARVP